MPTDTHAPVDELSTGRRWPRFALRGVLSGVAGLAIGFALWVLRPREVLADHLVHGLCISLATWLLIDGSRTVLRELFERGPLRDGRLRWPGRRWMLFGIVPVGALLGYTLGTALANRLLGQHAPGPFDAQGQGLVAILVVALLPAFAVTWLFHNREVIAAQRAQVARAAQQATEERLKLLESQLEPHMLFNTLANLRALIGHDPQRAQAMLDRLIAFLRASLVASRSATHPLSREFERLGDYLALMQVRMGERLRPVLTLPPALADEPVPPLLLQPLVENAIRHGLEPKRDGGRVVVEAALDAAGRLVVQVRDTGLGLGAAAVPTGAAPDPATAGTGVGVQLVRERLAALHGAAATLVLAPADDPDGGTVATVTMPRLPRTAVAPTPRTP